MDDQMEVIRRQLIAEGDYSSDEENRSVLDGADELQAEDEVIADGIAPNGQQDIDTVPTQKGRPKLVHAGHLFLFQKWNADRSKKFWKCDKYKGDGCPKRLHTTSTNVITAEVSEHNHETNPGRVGVHRVKDRLRSRAINTVEVVFASCFLIIFLLAAKSDNLYSRSGSAELCERTVAKQIRYEEDMPESKKRNSTAPPTPATRELYVIPDEYKHYSPEPGIREQFLLADSEDADRILIFGRSSSSTWIHLVQKIFIDGTFKIAPHHFYQIFVIMGERNGFVLPLLYALLPNKTEASYTKMFVMIKNLWPRFQPNCASLDYEMGLINAVKESFRGIMLGGCLFHLSKNMKLHLGNHHLLARYREGGMFTEGARMIVAIAFLRPADVEEALTVLDEYFTTNDLNALMPILDWFEENYVGHMTRNGRRPAQFRNTMWSVYQRTLDGEARTNNHVEAAHRRLQTELSADHPTLWTLIDGLRKAQLSRDVEYLRMINGEPEPKKRLKYILADRRLLTILQNYDGTTLLEKLKGIAQVYGMI